MVCACSEQLCLNLTSPNISNGNLNLPGAYQIVLSHEEDYAFISNPQTHAVITISMVNGSIGQIINQVSVNGTVKILKLSENGNFLIASLEGFGFAIINITYKTTPFLVYQSSVKFGDARTFVLSKQYIILKSIPTAKLLFMTSRTLLLQKW